MDEIVPRSAAQLSRQQRHPVNFDATVVRGAQVQPSRVLDLSLDGCCILGYFSPGEQVEIRIVGLGRFPAKIRWTRMGRAGARFIPTHKAATNLAQSAAGVAAIEYALLIALIALAVTAALANTGNDLTRSLDEVNSAMADGTQYQDTT